ncbi:MAG: cation:proton antiporter subunit C [Deltaproteobacteria bacterium]|nr:cation:proton antiporter subunit C [Deltaproteobacteria bacterium]MDP3030271.1 cation:proton antiporter subunit C [Deltaproteobacteria bacterium]
MFEYIVSKFNYWIYIFLMMLGLWAMIGKSNFVKKLIGMNIFQVSIILFYISVASKIGATIPILTAEDAHGMANPLHYMNPLPHVLMLTAIVVGIATTGVALAIIIMVYNRYKTLNEDEILEILRKSGV